jgi:hypothetical protein
MRIVGQGGYYSHERSSKINNTELGQSTRGLLFGIRVRKASQTSVRIFGLLTGLASDCWYLGLDLVFLFLLADVRAMVMPQRSSSCFYPIRVHMPA